MAKSGFTGSRMSGGANMNLLKQAQKMQQDMLKTRAEIEEQEFTSAAGGGMVTATVNGKHEIVSLVIDENAVFDASETEDVEMLSDAIIAALNEAMKQADDAMAQGMAKYSGGMAPGL